MVKAGQAANVRRASRTCRGGAVGTSHRVPPSLSPQVCPYFVSRDAATLAAADIVLLPYNYVVDTAARRGWCASMARVAWARTPLYAGLALVWERAIVIIDEAHNLV